MKFLILSDVSFDAGVEYGREQAVRSLETRPDEKPSPPPHSHKFLPWKESCTSSDCKSKNSGFIKDAHPEMHVRCYNCSEELGELQKAMELEMCPNCGAEGKMLEGIRD